MIPLMKEIQEDRRHDYMRIGTDWFLSKLTFDLGYSERLLRQSMTLRLDSTSLGAEESD